MRSWADADRWLRSVSLRRWRSLAVVVIVVVSVIAVGALLVRGGRSANVPHFTAPEGATEGTLPVPTTAPTGFATVNLASVAGTTTIKPVRTSGSARISGTVSASTASAAGVVVHLERVDGALVTDVAAAEDGRYEFVNLAGGGYTLRAYLPPALAKTEPEVFFVRDGEDHRVDLVVDQFASLVVTSAVAPDPPVVGQPFNIVVRVASRTVDADGVVRSTPVAGAIVALSQGANVVVVGGTVAPTTAEGTVTYLSSCKQPGPLNLAAVVKLTAADVGQSVPIDLPACTGSAVPGATIPGASTTSSTTTTTTTTIVPN
ncbi:MAG: carboxypeptidase-like regulatory domain-containing protein [Acidimicrobiales bacterium]